MVDRNARDSIAAAAAAASTSITAVATTANGANERRTGAKEDRSAVYAAAGFVAVLLGIAGYIAGNMTP